MPELSHRPLTSAELEAIITGYERGMAVALDAEERARRCMNDGSAVGAREWLAVAAAAQQLAKGWTPDA